MRGGGILALALWLIPIVASAQIVPSPSLENPRLQTVVHQPSRSIRLVAVPDSTLTVLFHKRERISRVVVVDPGAFDVSVTGEADGLNIVPRRADATTSLSVITDRRNYAFEVETGNQLTAAYLVRFVSGGYEEAEKAKQGMPDPRSLAWVYKLRGSKEIRPVTIGDDGSKTYIEWGPYQSIPAVFGIGPSGEEEVVDGYMRNGIFTIDRIYEELIFRIDREEVEAHRREREKE